MRAGLPEAVRRRLDPDQRFGLRLSLAALAIVLVAVPFSTLLFQVLAKGPLTRLDGRVANRLNDVVHGHPLFVHLLDAVSLLGKPPTLIAAAVIGAAVLLFRRRFRLAAFLVATSIGASIIDTVVKVAVSRPRPVVDHPVATALGKSFPSGHAMSSTVVYGALLLVFLPAVHRPRRRPIVAVTMVLVFAIGASRVLLGVHFVSDVVGGWVLGLAWLLGATAAFEAWRRDEGRPRSDPLEEGLEPEAAEDLRAG